MSADAYSDVALFGGQVSADSLVVEKSESSLLVHMSLDVAALKVKSNQEAWITPVLTSGTDTLRLPAVVVAGRNRYYQAERHGIPSDDVRLYRAGRTPSIAYSSLVPYQSWMDNAVLSVGQELRGCCSQSVDGTAATDQLAVLDFTPRAAARRLYEAPMVYMVPEVENIKIRALQGSAYIDFRVNRIDIDPEYRRNPVELGKILASVDTVKNDPDCHVTAMSFKGYASPEGSYSNNTRLASGRTATLREYVGRQYNFPDSIITTSWEAEDWEGLRRYVEASNLEHREQILAIIDSDLAPDPKNEKIRRTYPDEYKFLLDNVYPGLRHSDYRVEYVIRSFTDVREIAEVMRTAPQKLSLHELFALARSLDPGSDEYNEVFEVAVRMYPDSEVANLNAASTALSRRDTAAAARYLAKAGNAPQAIYARGVCAAIDGDYDTARRMLSEARAAGVTEAETALTALDSVEQ